MLSINPVFLGPAYAGLRTKKIKNADSKFILLLCHAAVVSAVPMVALSNS